MALRDSGGSCLKCRTRKVRCDRALPQCSQCKQRSLDCFFPEAHPRLLWLPVRTQVDFSLDQEQIELDMHVRRQPLFKASSICCRFAFPNIRSSIRATLEQLDYSAEGIDDGMSTSSGPFHAFRCERTTGKSTLSTTTSPNFPGLELWRLLSDNLGDALNEEDIITAPWSKELCFPDELLEINQQPEEAYPPLQLSQQEQPSVISPPDLEEFAMSTAKLLLDHYQNITATLYTPASVESKTPWEVCYVPNVLSTLGEIALTGTSSDAKASLLFAVLANIWYDMCKNKLETRIGSQTDTAEPDCQRRDEKCSALPARY
ncbi:hypothetical protein AN4606.2 [Aspergillus nidulans FGSC A4]|uniref:Zn(II)2Cys6 transcription factor (Eurofung) n=1 Tax=Emericella nidulans (strain FGSC A4 / ATCC 38163 / CBS 112.46 / NRRL 194 / M139) TaxID=227321 RepID=Q5B4C4_EMENI|nr:hypothetical protein [Aspergillus nidulans FGSC A4]EAA60408.1 hypothetical protein AN4606.2 [Aspergillus nidulans FGSC A4]CBF77162.1 TPA: Putative Zn(II)2Cys6 transcription factor (Eurofung) [Aspergillus nidulans FGSC A4]|eukprot:XP_662210.1 hypothetical protein AN4606.2 [Aspergillus nidulans FGSC A4]